MTKKLFYLFMMLPLFAVLLSLNFLPETIPTHFNAANIVDRWGSKYELLLMPLVALFLGGFLLGIARIARRAKGDTSANEGLTILIGIFPLIIINYITGLMIYTGIQGEGYLSVSFLGLEFEQVLFFLVGFSLLVMGNYMPKIRRNRHFGFRVHWIMDSDELWRKSQQFAGRCLVLAGLAIMLLSLIFRSIILFVLFLCALVIAVILSMIYSHRIAKRTQS